MKKIPLWEPALKQYDHITQGVKTKEFEEMFAEFAGAEFAVACTSGTTALLMALKAVGTKANHEVLIPDLTAPATMNATVLAGACPRFLDVERDSFLVNYHEFRDMNADVRIAVHLNGRVVEAVDALTIEDACHALGCKGVGWSDSTCYSFSPTKTIHTGQGGIVTTNDCYQYERLLKARQEEGNFKFSDLQAKIALEYMEQLPTILDKKRSVYQVYRHYLQGVDSIQLTETNVAESIPWLVDIMVERYKVREALITHLDKNGVETRRFYAPLSGRPNASFVSQRGLWLPSSVHLTTEDIAYVCDKIKEFFENHE